MKAKTVWLFFAKRYGACGCAFVLHLLVLADWLTYSRTCMFGGWFRSSFPQIPFEAFKGFKGFEAPRFDVLVPLISPPLWGLWASLCIYGFARPSHIYKNLPIQPPFSTSPTEASKFLQSYPPHLSHPPRWCLVPLIIFPPLWGLWASLCIYGRGSIQPPFSTSPTEASKFLQSYPPMLFKIPPLATPHFDVSSPSSSHRSEAFGQIFVYD